MDEKLLDDVRHLQKQKERVNLTFLLLDVVRLRSHPPVSKLQNKKLYVKVLVQKKMT